MLLIADYMKDYIIKRLLSAVPILLGVMILTFFLIHLLPGDPAIVLAGERATPEQISNIRQELGLDQPLYIQLAKYLANVAVFDFGTSLTTDRPVIVEIQERLPATIELTISSMIIAMIIGVGLGIIAAANKNTFIDTLCMIIALAGVSIPIFWLGLEVIYYFSYELQWFPTMGRGQSGQEITGLNVLDALILGDIAFLNETLSHLFLPALTLGVFSSAYIARMTRSSLIQVMNEEYIRVVRAKGGRGFRYWKHVIAAGFTPILTVIGLQIGTLLGGAILTEHVFSWPGLGSFLVRSVFARDFPSIQALVALSALIFVIINLTVDIITAIIDPRIRQKIESQV